MKTNRNITAILMLLFIVGINTNTQAQPKWRISSAGTSAWQDQPTGSGWAVADQHYADFDGDGKTDVFVLKNGQFLYSSAAKVKWETLNSRFASAKFSIDDLRFGDFNGDRKMDVFFAWKGYYGYVSAGKGTFIKLRKADAPLSQLGIGDFNGDGKADIFWQR